MARFRDETKHEVATERRRVIVFKTLQRQHPKLLTIAYGGVSITRLKWQVEGPSLLYLTAPDLLSCHFAFNPAVAFHPSLPAMPVTSKTELLITKAWSGAATRLEVAQPELALLDATQSALRWCLQSVTHQLCYWLQQSLVGSFQGFQDKLPMNFYAHSVFPGN